MGNLVFDKGTLAYETFFKIETVRKKLSDNLKPFEDVVMIKQELTYITNGKYMLKVKMDGILDGIYKIIKEKKRIILIPEADSHFPDVTEVEKITNYSELEMFKSRNPASAFCQVLRAMKEDEYFNYELFAPIFDTFEMGYFSLSRDKDFHKPVILYDILSPDTIAIAYIMPMWEP